MDGAAVDIRMKNDEKNKALEAAIGQIEKAFGKGSVMKLGQRESAVDVQAISTGSLGLDIGLGIGQLLLSHSFLDHLGHIGFDRSNEFPCTFILGLATAAPELQLVASADGRVDAICQAFFDSQIFHETAFKAAAAKGVVQHIGGEEIRIVASRAGRGEAHEALGLRQINDERRGERRVEVDILDLFDIAGFRQA